MTTCTEPSIQDITRRAYRLYLERGGQHGSDVDDWVKAEKELSDASAEPQVKTETAQATGNSSNKIYLGQYQSRRRNCID
jgi:Protein of unknown function (DUF2934)